MVTYETIFFGSRAVKTPLTPPPLPQVPSSINVSNTTIMAIEIDQIDQVDILLPKNIDNTLPALLPPPPPMEIELSALLLPPLPCNGALL